MRRDQPNVIVCLCDQLRAFEVGCYGNGHVGTPNADMLARQGVRFEIACSNNPVCTPGRSILLSGQYGRTCLGETTNCEEPEPVRSQMPDPTLPEVLRSAGYDTALIGKWHVRAEPGLLGFDWAVHPYWHHRYSGQEYTYSTGEKVTVEGYGADFEAEELSRYLSSRGDKPFLLYYNISQPHMPLMDAPERYTRMYSRDDVPLRPNTQINGALPWDERWFKIYLWDYLYYQHHLPYTEDLPEGFDLRDLTALYCGMATWADDQLGTLMRLLEANSLDENTIVLFTSDHGDNLGSHGVFNKDVLFEESIRVPMIVRWAKALAPRENHAQVASLVDVMPTLLALAEVPYPDTMQGEDLSPILRGEAETVGRNAAFIETNLSQIGIRTPTHLYGYRIPRESGDNLTHFYDLETDPYQQHNMADTGEQLALAQRLDSELRQWDSNTQWLDYSVA